MRFKVTGNHTVAGVDPGKTVDLDADDPRTQALVKAGHLSPAKATGGVMPKGKGILVGETGAEILKGDG